MTDKEPIKISVMFGDTKHGQVLGGYSIENADDKFPDLKKDIARKLFCSQYMRALESAIAVAINNRELRSRKDAEQKTEKENAS